MTSHELIILGGGGHAAVISEAAVMEGWEILGFIDDASDAKLPLPEILRLGPLINPSPETIHLILNGATVHAAAGSVKLRRTWYDYFPAAQAATIIHPSAVVSESALIKEGVFIGPNAVVNARAKIGRGVIINSGTIVEHDVDIGEFSHLAPGSIATGEVKIEADVMVGAGSVILPKILIQRGSVVGAGAVVTKDLPESSRVAGNPAQPLR